MDTLSESQILNIVDQAVEYGIKLLKAKNAMTLGFASVWIDGYIAGNKNLSENDIKSLRATIEAYKFF
jgi:hypothetical protein